MKNNNQNEKQQLKTRNKILKQKMRIKPSSANTKKSIISDKPILINQTNQLNQSNQLIQSKKPTIVKCFICNQMFYSQQTFDTHMDQHQKKVNKNLPQQIQRKTLQSFGLKRKQSINKKNTTLQAINQNQIKDKKMLNKTMKLPSNLGQTLSSFQSTQNPFITKYSRQSKTQMTKKPSTKIQQVSKIKQQKKRQQSQSPFKIDIAADKQIAQIDDAIKQSSLLMSQIAFITERYQLERQQLNIEADQTHSDHQDEQQMQIQKNVSENQFISMMRTNNWSLTKIQNQILMVNFTNHKSLQNCQIQIQYLRKLIKYSNNQKSLDSITKTKSKILAEVIKIINQEQKKQQSKWTNRITEPIQIKQQENSEARTCSECLDMIGFGQFCIVYGEQFYHKNCFQQSHKKG